MRFVGQILLGLSLLFGLTASPLPGAEDARFKPILTITTGSITDIVESSGHVAEIFAVGDQFELFCSALQQYEGLDLGKPIAFSLMSDGDGELMPLIILPIADIKKFEAPLKTLLEMQDSVELEIRAISDDRYILETPFLSLVFVQKGGFAFGTTEAYADNLPDNPDAVLLGLEKENVLALRVDFNNTSYEELSLLMAPLHMLGAMNPDPALQQNIEMMDRSLELLCAEMETLTWALKLDPKTADVSMIADYAVKPGGTMAKQIEAMKNAKSAFGGFFKPENTVFSGVVAGTFDPDDPGMDMALAQYGAMFEGMIEQLEENDDERSDKLIPVVEAVYELLEKTLESGKSEMAATLFNDATFLSACTVGDGKIVDGIFDQLVEIIEAEIEDADDGNVELLKKMLQRNYADLGGYKLSSVAVSLKTLAEEAGEAIPEGTPEALLNLQMAVIVGVKEDSVCMAAGLKSLEEIEALLKKAVEESKKPVALPKRLFVFSVPECGKMLLPMKDLVPEDEMDDNARRGFEILELLASADPDCLLTYDLEHGTNRMKLDMTLSGKVFPVCKKIFDLVQTESLEDVDFDDE